MPRDCFILSTSAISIFSIIAMFFMVIPAAGAPTTNQSAGLAEITSYKNSTQAYLPSSNITYFSTNGIEWYDTANLSGLSEGGTMYEVGVPTKNVTLDPTINQTLLDLENQMMQATDISMTIIKMVPFLLLVMLILAALSWLGYIPTFSSRRERETPDIPAGEQMVHQMEEALRPTQAQAPAVEEPQDEKKPEKRDRYEVIKV